MMPNEEVNLTSNKKQTTMEQAEQIIDEMWGNHDAITVKLADSPETCERYEHIGRKPSSLVSPPPPFLIRSDVPALKTNHLPQKGSGTATSHSKCEHYFIKLAESRKVEVTCHNDDDEGCDVVAAVVIENSVGKEACRQCSIDAKLVSRASLNDQLHSFYPNRFEYTINGVILLTFRMARVDLTSHLELFAIMRSVAGADSIEPNDRCEYRQFEQSKVIPRTELLSWMCNGEQELKKVAGDLIMDTRELRLMEKIKKADPQPNCETYSNGYWRVEEDLRKHRSTGVQDIYVWKESGCHSMALGPENFMLAAPTGLRVAFVGDSLLRNLFGAWMDDIGDHLQSNSSRIFEVYGYYPTVKPGQCCGENDCKQRQFDRTWKHKRGLEDGVLKHGLTWLGMKSTKNGTVRPSVLVLNSPAVHGARAYVSVKTHMKSVREMLRMVKWGREKFQYDQVIWMSTTPMRDWVPSENDYLDNRSDRRYRLYQLEKKLLDTHYPWIYQMDVWNMMSTRRDRMNDLSHVYPPNYREVYNPWRVWPRKYRQKPKSFWSPELACNGPCIIASTWSNMLQNMIYAALKKARRDAVLQQACKLRRQRSKVTCSGCPDGEDGWCTCPAPGG